MFKKIKNKIFNSKLIEKYYQKYNRNFKKFKINNIDNITKLYNLVNILTDKINLTKSETPEVSIIIPVYNQYSFTKACLYSISQNTQDINYEIIIADDNSTDETKTIEKNIPNIKVIRNKTNKGFLLNTKNAVKQAKGKYVVLLNNDIIVKEKWLFYLLQAIKIENTGIVGGKILRPNGLLQEVGVSIDRNFSIKMIDTNKFNDKNKYNKITEVDACTGCCILFEKSNWDKLGGFDEQFIPAYLEDTDLCMQFKYLLNLKILCQQKCEVYHIEGVTYKINAKNLCNINTKKFIKKWGKQ